MKSKFLKINFKIKKHPLINTSVGALRDSNQVYLKMCGWLSAGEVFHIQLFLITRHSQLPHFALFITKILKMKIKNEKKKKKKN